MNWSDLQPPVRAAIAVGVFLVILVLVWTYFVAPMRAREVTAQADIATAESQLEAMEREIESVPPATEAERAAWQGSLDDLLSRLGPESELPLFIESLVRLGDSQGVDVFLTSGGAAAVAGDPRRQGSGAPAEVQRVLGAVPGARYVPLEMKVYGDFQSSSRFLSQIGRLGWVTDIRELTLTRSFPEVLTAIRLVVYFRPTEHGGGTAGSAGPAARAGGQGGRGNG